MPVILMDGDPGDPAGGSPGTIDSLIDAYQGTSLPDCEIAIDDPAAILRSRRQPMGRAVC